MAATIKTNLQYSAQAGQLIAAINRVEKAQDKSSRAMVADIEKVNSSLKRQEAAQRRVENRLDVLSNAGRKTFEQLGGVSGALGSGMIELGAGIGLVSVAAGALGGVLLDKVVPAIAEALANSDDWRDNFEGINDALWEQENALEAVTDKLVAHTDLTREEAEITAVYAQRLGEVTVALTMWQQVLSGFQVDEDVPGSPAYWRASTEAVREYGREARLQRARGLVRLLSASPFGTTVTAGIDVDEPDEPTRPRRRGFDFDAGGSTLFGGINAIASDLDARIGLLTAHAENRVAINDEMLAEMQRVADREKDILEAQAEVLEQANQKRIANVQADIASEEARRGGLMSTATQIGGIASQIAGNFIEGQRPMAAFQAAMQLGFGLAALVLNPAAAPIHFASAAQFGLAAAFAPGGGGGAGSRRPTARAPGPAPSSQFNSGGQSGGDGGTTINVMVQGSYYSSRDDTRREIVNLVDEAQRLGELRRAL